MSTYDKLDTINDSLNDIKTAIIAKGQTPSGNITTYATAIGNISTLNAQTKTVTPTTSQQVIEPDNNYNALSQVTVNAVTSSIDANIQAGNIKNAVTILGVTGTYQGSGGGGVTGLPNWSSSNITTFQKQTWFTAPSDGWVHYAHLTPSSTHRQFQIKDPQGNIVFYGIVGKTLNTGAFTTIHVFVPQGYSYYAETADIATYDSVTQQYVTTQGAFFIPAYT